MDEFNEREIIVKRLRGLFLSIAAAAGILGCAAHPPTSDAQAERIPLHPAEQVARLALHSSRTFPGRPTSAWWWVDVIAVDAKPMPNDPAVVEVVPGQHALEYMCLLKFQFNDTGGAKSQGTIKVWFEAGKTYYAHVSGKMTSHQSVGASGIKSQGDCAIESISETNPNSLP